ncbi:MAG: TetR/AcrR family transcriptional regulator [Shewanella fodinae]|nr:TetR/AcrR family transcriptional regulator [Shewanella fodinae]
MDMVSTQAKVGKATVYRRWSSKAELVRDAMVHMSRNSLNIEHLPDTGTLRGDLMALLKPHSLEYSERKLKVLAGLGSFYAGYQEIAEDAMQGIFEPWSVLNRTLMLRAQERGEISPQADIDMACEIIVAMVTYHSSHRTPCFLAKKTMPPYWIIFCCRTQTRRRLIDSCGL